MTDKQFRFARTSQCYCLGQRENACSKMNCTHLIRLACMTIPQGVAAGPWSYSPTS